MTVFADYARYYNLLYREKDYAEETNFVLETLRQHGCSPKTLLDLGCGTGRHALEMARRGIAVTGVDMSETMLSMGREQLSLQDAASLPSPLPDLYQGDARTFRGDRQFDAVTSLFHVMSYQNTEEDALAVLLTAREHLCPDGFFLFDFWYGPGVLTDLPTIRERLMEDDLIRIHRRAVPEHRVEENTVTVNYTVTITDKNEAERGRLEESHSMRYWFLPELRYLAKQAGLQVCGEGGWMHAHAPGMNDWNAWMLVRV